jgi:hypothetical protein
MKFHRIRLSNFRGVDDRDVAISPDGVTVIEGPNEIGKSSMAEAIDLLFEELDSTSKRRVLATKPVGRDVGPRVEVDVECDLYRFTYAKRFLRERSTELEIVAPRRESIGGREAHERVQAILAESVDVALWKALRIRQGVGVDQADLLNQLWLSAALDRAAGESPAGEEEKSLFAVVHDEYLINWTETGRRKQEVIQLERAIEDVDARIGDIEESLRSIDSDIEASVRFRAELARLEDRRAEASRQLSERELRVDALGTLETDATRARLELEGSSNAADAARRALTMRTELIAAVESAKHDLAELASEQASVREERDAVDQRVRDQDAERAVAHTRARTAADAVEGLRSRLQVKKDQEELATTEVRLQRLEAAEAIVRKHADSAALPVDAGAMDAIRSRQRDLDLALARAEAEQVSISIEAFGDVRIEVDGTLQEMRLDETLRLVAQESTEVVVPDALSLTVFAGDRGSVATEGVVIAQTALDEALAGVGVADVAEAEAGLRSKLEADRTIEEARRSIKDLLADETWEALGERLAGLRDRTTKRGQIPDDDKVDREALRAEVDAADRELVEAQVALEQVEAALQLARGEQADLRSTMLASDIAFGVATKECERRSAQLSTARAEVSDDELQSQMQEAEITESDSKELYDAADDRLKAEGADAARVLLTNARDAYGRIDAEIHQTRESLVAVEARLKDRGEDGLAEDRDEASAKRERLQTQMQDYQRRADARRLLYETFKEERTASRRGYVAPLQREIERLGSVVFGPDFGVELDDDSLRVVSRTLGGRTVSFDSLSVGAQEQIALISRLACAMIVAPEGGVPIILDDALGNSDRSRLEGMGAVLALAGRDCQVIILTCQPDRYAFVGSASVVQLQ